MTTPAGWYDDGSGRQRWWDGTQWTEHFAPVDASEVPAEAQAVAAESPAQAETPVEPGDMSTTPDAAADVPAYTAPEQIAPEQVAPEQVAPEQVAAAPATPEYTVPGYTAPGATEQTPPYAQQTQGQYPGAAPAYPGTTPSYPAAGAYAPAAPAYGAPGGYPAAYGAPVATPAPMSIIGLVGLGLAVLGTILSCIPFTFIVGWVLLAVGFVVSVISLFLKGKKWPGIAGLSLSVVGTILAFVMAIVFVATTVADQIDDFPTDYPSSSSTDDGDDGDDFDGFGPTDVVEGELGETVTVTQMSGVGEVTIESATWSTSNGTSFPSENGGFLTVNLTWTGVEGTSNVNPFYLAIETAEGAEGVYDYFSDSQLESGELLPGDTVAGNATFDVAQSGSYVVIITDELLREVARIAVTPSAG